MEIKDYLHLYIGCEVAIKGHKNAILGAVGIDYGNRVIVRWPLENEWSYADVNEIKPILRKLSDMTEEDGIKIFGSETKYLLYRKEAREFGADLWLFTANEYTRLLKEGFDCHDLIPAGLAIDKTSLKN